MGRAEAEAAFRQIVGCAEHLRWRVGLSAIKRGEGHGQIRAASADRLWGSVDVDGDCKAAYPEESRWDYAIGYGSEGGSKAQVFFVEVHSAVSSQVSAMAKKLDWLKGFLNRPRSAPLARLRREYHWVASGKVDIPRHLPQYRNLARLRGAHGLKGPDRELTLR
jgi:hypothetical protein